MTTRRSNGNQSGAKKQELISTIEGNLYDAVSLLELMHKTNQAGYDVTPAQILAVLDVSIPKIREAIDKLDQYATNYMQQELGLVVLRRVAP